MVKPMAGVIYTIGYGNNSREQFFERVRVLGATHIVDVRSRPFSKYKKEFDRGELDVAATQAGFKYVYLGDRLGGMPDREDLLTDGRADHSKMRRDPLYQAAIHRVVDAAKQGKVLVLMCGCAEPIPCHRGRLLSPDLETHGILVRHEVGGLLIGQKEAELKTGQDQSSLF